jgi:Polyketide cyclase / dehydrase and lipid transport
MMILYILLGLIAVLLLIALILPASYTVMQTIDINKSAQEVSDRIADLNHYREWNPWQKSDPAASFVVTGAPQTTGHKYAWEGKKVGMGSLTLKSLQPGSQVVFDLEFIKPWSAKALDKWDFEHAGNGSTKVTWSNTGELPYPMGRLMGPVLNKQLNKQFAEGLQNLKSVCEA